MRTYKRREICKILGLTETTLFEFVDRDWIQPASEENDFFDDEDLTRVRLILDLKNEMGVNDEAIPIILHLIDEIHKLHCELRDRRPLETR